MFDFYKCTLTIVKLGSMAIQCAYTAKGRVTGVSVGRSVCLSAPNELFEWNRLVYELHMSQK